MRRSLITSGELQRMIIEDGLRGITSNPTIFQKAIAGSSDYDDAIRDSVKSDLHMDVRSLLEKLVIRDIQMSADILRPIYERTDGADGFVSLELSPHLARDTEGSITEARRLWKKVNRSNLMLKVPATHEGIPVIETLIAEGINVNVTLMFSLSHYEAVVNAYIQGLERCSDPHKVASVASFFLSRIDRVVDKALEEIGTPDARGLRGKIAIANAKMAYKNLKEIFSGERWERLAKRGARVQRVLWASTSTKNPAYSDVLYIEELIGQNTINTIPPVTIGAFRDHGQVRPTLEEEPNEAENLLKKLAELDIDLDAFTDKLQVDGVNSFADSIDNLLSALEKKRQTILSGLEDPMILKLGHYQIQVNKRLEYWKDINFMRRLWGRDPTLWIPKPTPELSDRLGWLGLPELMHEQLEDFISLTEEVKSEGMQHVVLLGMGGSSLASEVFQNIFGNAEGYPELIVLDSTHPSTIDAVENKIDLHKTLFLVSSKSGTTIETLSLFKYFWNKMDLIDEAHNRHFVAISDPGTPLMQLAQERGFRKAFPSLPDVGGRYSALTAFGLLPAALIGLDIHKFIDRAWMLSENCAFCVPSHKVSGLILGATLGELSRMGRDKITFLASPSINSFTVWIEQLIAESTGKDGKGIVPVVNEPVTSLEAYGMDRLFVYLSLEEDAHTNVEINELVKALETKGHPMVHINLTEKINLSQEIFRWEIAVAAAGAILRINPFNQPDVQAAKDLAKNMMEKAEKGVLNDEDEETVSAEDLNSMSKAFKNWIGQVKEGDYVVIQAYLSSTPDTTDALQKLRLELLKRLRLATTLGYGPRFLHSTGQLHKGGPNTGIFLQLVDEPVKDLEVPETNYTFGTLIRAQALGDYQALKQLNGRVLRINLNTDIATGLSRLEELIKIYEKTMEE